MNILFLSGWFPYPPDNGSKLRISNLLQGLAKKHDITLLTFANLPVSNDAMTSARSLCREVHVVPWRPFKPTSIRARLGLFSLTPRSVVDTFSPEMKQAIDRAFSAKSYNLIIASQITTAGYAPFFRGVPAMFEESEVGTLYDRSANATSITFRLRYGMTWIKHRRYIARLLRYFRACTVVSEQERELLSRCAPEFQFIRVIPNCIHLNEYPDQRAPVQPNTLIFTGSFRYFANHEAMVWFLSQVYPRIQAAIPDVRLTITGDHADLPLPRAGNVTLTGFVDKVQPLIGASSVGLAPIRQGGGTRVKILEAMALRTPVVATTKGAEGLDVRHDEHLLIADTPEDFSYQVVRLLQEPQLRRRLGDNGYHLVQEKYDWAVVMPRFIDFVESIVRA